MAYASDGNFPSILILIVIALSLETEPFANNAMATAADAGVDRAARSPIKLISADSVEQYVNGRASSNSSETSTTAAAAISANTLVTNSTTACHNGDDIVELKCDIVNDVGLPFTALERQVRELAALLSSRDACACLRLSVADEQLFVDAFRMADVAYADVPSVRPFWKCLPCRRSFADANAFREHCRDAHHQESDSGMASSHSGIVRANGTVVALQPLAHRIAPRPGQCNGDGDTFTIDVETADDAGSPTTVKVEIDSARLNSLLGCNASDDDCDDEEEEDERTSLGAALLGASSSSASLTMSVLDVATPAAQQMSRNSAKTLKCPKCNWHYKYQETLEIHMRDKHPPDPSGEQGATHRCAYCSQKTPHPRLGRGESYSCGYKPYRCEICNYSTTSKGNLSIHMQSDKHLNNLGELQKRNQGQLLTSDMYITTPDNEPVIKADPSTGLPAAVAERTRQRHQAAVAAAAAASGTVAPLQTQVSKHFTIFSRQYFKHLYLWNKFCSPRNTVAEPAGAHDIFHFRLQSPSALTNHYDTDQQHTVAGPVAL